MPKEHEIRIYARSDGAEPYTVWERGLADRTVRGRIRARIARLRLGNFGDSKRVGEVFELRIDVGPGYRVYYGREGDDVVILLCGGDKASQARDIERAEAYWVGVETMAKARDYREHLDQVLRNDEEAVAYLNAALAEDDPETFLLALRDVARAREGGLAALAETARVNREHLYRMLSENGNPELRSLEALLDALGFRLSVELKTAV